MTGADRDRHGDRDSGTGGADRERRAREIAEEAERTRNPGNAVPGMSGEDPGTGERHWPDRSGSEPPRPSPQGKGDVHAVSGPDIGQPEIAEGPVPGMQPGEKVERGPWIPPVEVDPPKGGDLPRDAAGERDAVRRQKEEGGP
ncbi:hypothetical protein CUT44_03630 [Streptomyces carminius]|uniref:Uncharacterized protein n=1 Tax=Streptomyces carminius TaxID=2665496 RepID=A0A2M8M5X7_9ACTN|nr:hypothetical protein [Streptomyces carminius]PJE99609.1 hypothetical protein CUT44_03630 [Streptomyces carminius]